MLLKELVEALDVKQFLDYSFKLLQCDPLALGVPLAGLCESTIGRGVFAKDA